MLLKVIVQSIPTYTMTYFRLPSELCDDIYGLMATFWWVFEIDKRTLHWLSWEKLCKPKALGGLGFNNLVLFNQALLTKKVWRMVDKPNSLVSKGLKGKYFPHCGILEANVLGHSSFLLKSLTRGREPIRMGTR